MEFTNNQTEQAVPTANEALQTQIDAIASEKVTRVKSFREYAFEKAGLNRGDHLSLKIFLKWIKDGHLVNETRSDNKKIYNGSQSRNEILM